MRGHVSNLATKDALSHADHPDRRRFVSHTWPRCVVDSRSESKPRTLKDKAANAAFIGIETWGGRSILSVIFRRYLALVGIWSCNWQRSCRLFHRKLFHRGCAMIVSSLFKRVNILSRDHYRRLLTAEPCFATPLGNAFFWQFCEQRPWLKKHTIVCNIQIKKTQLRANAALAWLWVLFLFSNSYSLQSCRHAIVPRTHAVFQALSC